MLKPANASQVFVTYLLNFKELKHVAKTENF